MRTVLNALAQWRAESGTRKVWTFLNDKGEPVDDYTYEELDKATTFLAYELLEKHKLKRNDRILLVFFPGLDFTASLLACFKAGLIAVPVFPPDPRKLKKDLDHFVNIQKNSGAGTVLTHGLYNFVKKIEGLKGIFSTGHTKWPDLRWITVDDTLKKGKKLGTLESKQTDALVAPLLTDIAFLQYTSGSTSDPKGVMISHGNLAHNLKLIIAELKADESTINVSWLPQYHDMGLIGSYLGLLYCGGTGFYLSPISFLKDPVVWIRSLSRFKGTHTQAPNFAFALVSRKFSEYLLEEFNQSPEEALAAKSISLDLSSVRHMINAAEPVDFYAIRSFYRMFCPYGLPPGVVAPTYGLAEHTVYVCSGGRQVLSVTKASLEAGTIDIQCTAELFYSPEVNPELEKAESSPFLQMIVGCGYPHQGEDVEVAVVDISDEERPRAIAVVSAVAQQGASMMDAADAKDHGGPDAKIGSISEAKSEVKVETGDGVGDRAGAEAPVVGEVWVRSPSKALGYWEMEELSKRDFHAQLLDASSSAGSKGSEKASVSVWSKGEGREGKDGGELIGGGYLRTGDLGFIYLGELFICGRLKDLIIVGGSNHYPQDLERSAESALPDQLRPGCSAAFALTAAAMASAVTPSSSSSSSTLSHQVPSDNESAEYIVYVAELKPGVGKSDYESIARKCREVVASEHGIGLSAVCLLESRSIPKTTSGKIARSWCRKAFLNGTLQVLYRWSNGNASVSVSVSDSIDAGLAAAASAAVQTKTAAGAEEVGSISGGKSFQYQPVAEAEGAKEGEIGGRTAVAGDGSGAAAASAGGGPRSRKRLSIEEVRALPVDEVAHRLEELLREISMQGAVQRAAPISLTEPVANLGLDSMTLVQFKGVLEKRFYCEIPDEFMYTSMAHLSGLAEAVHEGRLTASQASAFEQTAEAKGGGSSTGDATASTAAVAAAGGSGVSAAAASGADGSSGNKSGGGKKSKGPQPELVGSRSEPCCPWFICCY